MKLVSDLAAQLRDGRLVAFIGAGTSARFQDEQSGRSWPGLPMAGELVSRMAQQRNYVLPNQDFPQASFLWKQRENRRGLEQFLLTQLDRTAVKPLPAHTLLATLPFSAYFTTNFDTLMEQALREARRPICPVIQDIDVARLTPTAVPVVKINGCVSRPSTMVAAEDEFVPLADRAPIVEALTKTELANKSVLFVGYSLSDQHFAALFQTLRRTLGEYAPTSYAIVQETDEYRRAYWESAGVSLIDADLTDALRGVARATQVEVGTKPVSLPGEDWINNAFFVSLSQIGSLPSETQVIDAFLDHLVAEIHSPTFAVADIVARADQALQAVISQRPNYEALQQIGAQLLGEIRSGCTDKDDAEGVVRALIASRRATSEQFASVARSVIKQNDSVLVFSQSVRVLEILKGVPRGTQATCQVFVAECRPKSPRPFQDAIAICEHLRDTGFDITVVPDAAVGHLMARGQVSKVLMGAHAIHVIDGQPAQFVNTCGSHLICVAAEHASVPVYLIAESGKLKAFEDLASVPPVSFKEEEELFQGVVPALGELEAGGQRVTTINIGYDLCPLPAHAVLVTEDGIYAPSIP